MATKKEDEGKGQANQGQGQCGDSPGQTKMKVLIERIFLIAAGWTDWTPSQQGAPGFYWSITPVENSTTNKDAYVFYFDQNNGSFSNQGTTYHSPTANQYASYGHGFMVRLVYDPNATPWTQE